MGGGRCGSPALRGEHYCYFHAGAYRTIPIVGLWPEEKPRFNVKAQSRAAGRRNSPSQRARVAAEGKAIQQGLLRAVRALMEDRINLRQGKIILKTLCEASTDWRRRVATADSAVTSNRVERVFRPASTSQFWELESASADGRVSPAKVGRHKRDRGDAALKRRSTPDSSTLERGGE